MKINLSKRNIGIGVAVIVGLGLLVFMKRGPQQPGAVVNSENIDMAPIVKQVENLGKADPGRFDGESGTQEADYVTQMLLTDAIAAKAAQQAALQAGVSVSEAEIDHAIAEAAKASKKSVAEYIDMERELGYSEASLRDMMAGQAAISKMRIKLAKEARVTPAEIGAYIAGNLKTFENPIPQVKLSVITVNDSAAAAAVLTALKKGADFNVLAKERSIEKEADIGWHPTAYLETHVASTVEAIPVGGFATEYSPNPDNTLSIYKVEDRQTRMSSEDEKRAQVGRRILRFRQSYSFTLWYKETAKNAKITKF